MAIFSVSSTVGNGMDSSLCQFKRKTKNVPVKHRDCKADGKPKRNLSSYNIFFQFERARILSNQKVGFEDLGRKIASRWNSLDSDIRDHFDDLAAEDKARYKREMKSWKKSRKTTSAKSLHPCKKTDTSVTTVTIQPPTKTLFFEPNLTNLTPSSKSKRNNPIVLSNVTTNPSLHINKCNNVHIHQNLQIPALAAILDDDCIDLLLGLIQ